MSKTNSTSIGIASRVKPYKLTYNTMTMKQLSQQMTQMTKAMTTTKDPKMIKWYKSQIAKINKAMRMNNPSSFRNRMKEYATNKLNVKREGQGWDALVKVTGQLATGGASAGVAAINANKEIEAIKQNVSGGTSTVTKTESKDDDSTTGTIEANENPKGKTYYSYSGRSEN